MYIYIYICVITMMTTIITMIMNSCVTIIIAICY